MEDGALPDLCPACGVKKTMFVPDTDKLSEKRRTLIDSHIHGIIVHFPQAFAFAGLFLILALFIAPQSISQHLWSTTMVLLFSLPFVVIGGFVTGIIDGKTRFRKVTTPMLKQKIAWGIGFFVISLLLFIINSILPIQTLPIHLIATVLLLAAAVCATILGKLGGTLVNSKFQG